MANSSRISKAENRPYSLWFGALIPLALILVAAGLYLLIWGDRKPRPHETDEPATAIVGQDYYILIRTIELFPQRPDGEDWDRDGSAPDIRYELLWQDNVVFKSKERQNTLIASWDALALDLKTAILSGQIDLGGAIDAAIIHLEVGTEVVLNVWDADLMNHDDAGSFPLRLDALSLGDNIIEFEATTDCAVKRIVVRMIDKTLPLSELIEAATTP